MASCETVTFDVAADAYVDQRSAGTNFGTAPKLDVVGGKQRMADEVGQDVHRGGEELRQDGGVVRGDLLGRVRVVVRADPVVLDAVDQIENLDSTVWW